MTDRGTMVATSLSVGEALLHVYRDLVPAEAKLRARGVRVGASVADQWPVLHDHLHLYGRALCPAGMLVLGGRPDAGSRATGIPFTGAPEARRHLGLDAAGTTPSPCGAAFWRAVERSRPEGAALEALFATAHLAHAQPFDADAPAALDAARAHLLRLLSELRPQAVVAVGADALRGLGRALGNVELLDLAAAESAWTTDVPLHRRPALAVDGPRPFRTRLACVPALDGPRSAEGQAALASLLALAWG